MPRKNFENIGTLQDYEYLKGVITDTPDTINDTCTVQIKVAGKDTNGSIVLRDVEFPATPIFYHCSEDAVERENGALEGAAAGFAQDDEVIVLKQCTGTSPNIFVIGHIDGIKRCGFHIIIGFQLWNWSTNANDYVYWCPETQQQYELLSPIDDTILTQPFSDSSLSSLGTTHQEVLEYNNLWNKIISSIRTADMLQGENSNASLAYPDPGIKTSEKLHDKITCGTPFYFEEEEKWCFPTTGSYCYQDTETATGVFVPGVTPDPLVYRENDFIASASMSGIKITKTGRIQGFYHINCAGSCSPVGAPDFDNSYHAIEQKDTSFYIKQYLRYFSSYLVALSGSVTNKDDSTILDLALIEGNSSINSTVDQEDEEDASYSNSMSLIATITSFNGHTESKSYSAGNSLPIIFTPQVFYSPYLSSRFYGGYNYKTDTYFFLYIELIGLLLGNETFERSSNKILLNSFCHISKTCNYTLYKYTLVFAPENFTSVNIDSVYTLFGTTKAAREAAAITQTDAYIALYRDNWYKHLLRDAGLQVYKVINATSL
jgi:hypothetical protein